MREIWQQRPYAGLFLIISYFIWGAVTLRWLTVLIEGSVPFAWLVAVILFAFGALMGLEPALTRNSRTSAHAYLALQTILVLVASLFYYELDFFALLYVPLSGQAMFLLPRREGFLWTGLLILVTAVGQFIQFGGFQSLSFTMLYAAALVFVALFVDILQQADKARRHSDQLLAELQDAHKQLQAYANQAEELAIANERTRLARDLHDSVAQTLYGLTLQAEAASRKLTAGRTQAVQEDLAAIREDAQQTLQETRLLIFELRPPILKSKGLSAALRARLEAVEVRSGITIHQELQEVHGLSKIIETGLYRIAQEALNNAARYAKATELHVLLVQTESHLKLEISDNGIGFNKEQVPSGSVGLVGMAERAEQMGGNLTIDTAPNKGTRIQVEIPL